MPCERGCVMPLKPVPRPPIRYGEIDGESVAYIPLTKGEWAIVDRRNLCLVKGCWWLDIRGYPVQRRGGRVPVPMQNVIMPPPPGKITDHKFGNPLDNRESQLRYATRPENCKNLARYRNNTSGYKGVHWDARSDRWIAQISIAGRRVYLGCFVRSELIEAAKAYDAAAMGCYGEFARLNFPCVKEG